MLQFHQHPGGEHEIAEDVLVLRIVLRKAVVPEAVGQLRGNELTVDALVGLLLEPRGKFRVRCRAQTPLTIPAAIAMAALLLMMDGLLNGTLDSPVFTSMSADHQPLSFHGYSSSTLAMYFRSSFRPPSLCRM